MVSTGLSFTSGHRSFPQRGRGESVKSRAGNCSSFPTFYSFAYLVGGQILLHIVVVVGSDPRRTDRSALVAGEGRIRSVRCMLQSQLLGGAVPLSVVGIHSDKPSDEFRSGQCIPPSCRTMSQRRDSFRYVLVYAMLSTNMTAQPVILQFVSSLVCPKRFATLPDSSSVGSARLESGIMQP